MGSSRTPRIGELLAQQGVLSVEQVDAILAEQQNSGRPFGDLAERMYDVSPEAVEQAWIDQYLTYETEIDLNDQRIDIDVLRVLNRRQAWQFQMLPMRREQDEMIVATTRRRLARAVNFAWHRLHDPVFFLIARRPQLEAFLKIHYPWPAMDAFEAPVLG